MSKLYIGISSPDSVNSHRCSFTNTFMDYDNWSDNQKKIRQAITGMVSNADNQETRKETTKEEKAKLLKIIDDILGPNTNVSTYFNHE